MKTLKAIHKIGRLYACVFLTILLTFGNTPPLFREEVAQADITTGLIGHWTFDEGAGTTANDSSGQGHHGTLVNGPVWGQDEAGSGVLVFDGVDDYVDLGDIDDLELGPEGELTISLWAKPDDSNRAFLIGRTGGESSEQNWTFALAVDNRNLLYFYLGDGVNKNYGDIAWPRRPPNTWYHLAVTVGGLNGTMEMYLNGKKITTGKFKRTIEQLKQSSESFKIGGETNLPWYFNTYFKGKIDDVRLYNRALAEDEILALNSQVNKAPAVYGQEITATRNTPYPVLLQAVDPNKEDTLTYTVIPPSSGTLTGIAPNLTYAPNSGFTGPDFFTFKASDGSLESTDGATVSIAVNISAFPGAEGFGAAATGGRGGRVLHVTTLKDNGDSKNPLPGSLRWALLKETGPRIIVFDVGGMTDLKTLLGVPKGYGDYTIAGQTAPGGITIRGELGAAAYPDGATNFIIRHLRIRNTHGGESHGMSLHGSNFILDHLSIAGGCDENIGSYSTKFTIQWSTLEEACKWGEIGAQHGEGSHNKGFLQGYNDEAVLTFHHNIIANVPVRLPLSTTNGGIDFRNNIITGISEFYGSGYFNIVNNFYVHTTRKDLIRGNGGYFYPFKFAENLLFKDPDLPPAPELVEYYNCTYNYTDDPWPAPFVTTQTALEAYESVLDKAGAWPRDAMTRRTMAEIQTITTQNSEGIRGPYEYFPEIKGPSSEEYDQDRDGMPDDWELAHGLNPADPEDRNNTVPAGVSERHAGYTYIEYYINELADSLVGQSGQIYTVQTKVLPDGSGAAIIEQGIYDNELDFKGGYNVPYVYGRVTFGTAEYNEGSIAIMKAKPKPGYEFDHWEGGPVNGLTSTRVSFPVTGDVTLTAHFKPLEDININVSISPDMQGGVAGKGAYKKGEIVTLAAYSGTGYKFKRWIGTPIDGLTNPTVQFLAQGNLDITAEFEPGTGGDILIDDFNDQNADSYLLGATGNPKKWGLGKFHEIGPGDFALTCTSNSDSLSFALGSSGDTAGDAEIPEGTTILKFKIYNLGTAEATASPDRNLVWTRISWKTRKPESSSYWSTGLFPASPFKFPVIQPGESGYVEIPINLIRDKGMTKLVEPREKLSYFSFGVFFRGDFWGTRVAADDVAFGRAAAGPISAPNLPPVANAGRDQTTRDCDGDEKEVVLLNGLKSHDGNAGLIKTWSWKEEGTEIATGFAPSVELPVGEHNITLIVQDEDAATSSDTVQITVLEKEGPSLPGDVNGDGEVDLTDLVIVARAFGSRPGDTNWDPRADIDKRGASLDYIDISDLVVVARNFGRTT